MMKVKFIHLLLVMDVRGKLLAHDSSAQSVLIMICAVPVKVKVFIPSINW